jgi:hypothetical protein
MMGDFIHLSQRFFSMTRINHADWAVAFLSMTRINHADWAMHGPMDIRDLDYCPGALQSWQLHRRRPRCLHRPVGHVERHRRLERDLGCGCSTGT